MLLRRSLLFILLVTPTLANAGWAYNLAPGAIRVVAVSGSVTFAPTNASVIQSTCASADFYIISTSNNAKMVLGVLLTAKSMGKNVTIYLPEDPQQKCDATTGRPAFTDITLVD